MVSTLKLQKAIIYLVLLGSSVAIISADDSLFPFSNYPMYSKVFEPHYQTTFWSIRAEFHDGTISRFDTHIGSKYGLKPFWGSSLRESLLVINDKNIQYQKLKSLLRWHQFKAKNDGLGPGKIAKKLQLLRHNIAWSEVVKLRLQNKNIKTLFDASSVVHLEVD